MRTPDHLADCCERALKQRQRKAIAQDMRSRGQNPVTVSDVRQRYAAPAGQGRPFLTTQLENGR